MVARIGGNHAEKLVQRGIGCGRDDQQIRLARSVPALHAPWQFTRAVDRERGKRGFARHLDGNARRAIRKRIVCVHKRLCGILGERRAACVLLNDLIARRGVIPLEIQPLRPFRQPDLQRLTPFKGLIGLHKVIGDTIFPADKCLRHRDGAIRGHGSNLLCVDLRHIRAGVRKRNNAADKQQHSGRRDSDSSLLTRFFHIRMHSVSIHILTRQSQNDCPSNPVKKQKTAAYPAWFVPAGRRPACQARPFAAIGL
ncbi:hypothetical protein SDC9_103529 [bioreactor metagenome]|uniref:Uncharacterized protein n=1 Tax=bioreactor metagenome TaxID=1076179 RepID=A0A645ATY4_9ZZZZ